jgi:hypothetical protein
MGNMSRTVSLPWYDLPSNHEAIDKFWSILRKELLSLDIDRLPKSLIQSEFTIEQWESADLLISQCCGLDLFGPAAYNLVSLCRPVFSNLDCEDGNYFSHIVSRKKLPDLPRIAVNSLTSHSGYSALLEWMSKQGIPSGEIIISGSHQRSIKLIQKGSADLAAIDAHSWLFLNHDGIMVLDKSAEAPSPPFVSGRDNGASHWDVLAALESAVSKQGRTIGIERVIPCGIEAYEPMMHNATAFGLQLA